MQYLNDPKYVAATIIAVLILLISPNFRCFFNIFDYTIIHAMFLGLIFYISSTDINIAIIITLIYMICVFQHQRVMMEELLDANMANPDISTFVRYKLALRVISNDTISDATKTDFVIRSMNAKSKAMHRLNILLSYMNQCVDPELKTEVLDKFFDLNGKNVVVVTKMMLDDKENLRTIFDSMSKSHIENSDKIKII